MSEDAITTAVEKHYARNQHLRLEFEQRGVDLDAPRPIEFHFWAWPQRDAAVVARSLYQMGFLVRLIALRLLPRTTPTGGQLKLGPILH